MRCWSDWGDELFTRLVPLIGWFYLANTVFRVTNSNEKSSSFSLNHLNFTWREIKYVSFTAWILGKTRFILLNFRSCSSLMLSSYFIIERKRSISESILLFLICYFILQPGNFLNPIFFSSNLVLLIFCFIPLNHRTFDLHMIYSIMFISKNKSTTRSIHLNSLSRDLWTGRIMSPPWMHWGSVIHYNLNF